MTLSEAATARAVQALAVARDAGFATRIATVRSSDQELTFVLASGLEIRFGDSSSLRLKLAVAERVLPLVRGTRGYVDLAVPARPIASANPQVGG
jgi:hypothetical protein